MKLRTQTSLRSLTEKQLVALLWMVRGNRISGVYTYRGDPNVYIEWDTPTWRFAIMPDGRQMRVRVREQS
jgi:hypothetical protein